MTKTFRLMVCLVVLFVASPPKVDGCFITTENVFAFKTRPDADWKAFLGGDLGVIQPTWRDRCTQRIGNSRASRSVRAKHNSFCGTTLG
jgi:hypothetical protein